MTVQPSGTAVLGTYAAVASAVIRLPKRLALAAIIPIIAIVDIGILATASERFLVFAWTNIAYVFMFVIGHLLRLSENHQIQAQELLEEEERTRLARNEAAALDERGRIARELHDVLAHSLSALSVELEGARLLALDRDVDSDVIAAIGRAHRHAASGLDEARAAIKALRGDSVPGPDKLEELLEDMRAQRHRVHAGDRRRAAAAALRSGAGGLPHRPGGAHQRAQARRGGRAGGDPPRLRPRRRAADRHRLGRRRGRAAGAAAGGAGRAPAPATASAGCASGPS